MDSRTRPRKTVRMAGRIRPSPSANQTSTRFANTSATRRNTTNERLFRRSTASSWNATESNTMNAICGDGYGTPPGCTKNCRGFRYRWWRPSGLPPATLLHPSGMKTVASPKTGHEPDKPDTIETRMSPLTHHENGREPHARRGGTPFRHARRRRAIR